MVHSHDFYKQYQDAYIKYTELYGKQVCVFLKKGSFYEFYGQETSENVSLNTAKQIMEIFGIAIHVYPNEAPNRNTGFFGGVPDYTLDKWAGKLTKLGWTVVVIDEKKNTSTGRVTSREVTRILSAGTHLDSAEANSSFFISSVWLASNSPPSFGVASADLTTGQVYLYEGSATGTSNSWHTDDIRHFFQVYPPRELIVYSSEAQQEDVLRRTFHIPSAPIHMVSSDGSLELPLTREIYLRKLFQPKTALPLRTWLHTTEDSFRERALCRLLRFAEDHAPNLASCLQAPKLWHPTETLQIINNALSQLNFISSSEQMSVESLFATPCTAMGKRALTSRLCTPLTDASTIQERQGQVRWVVETELQPEIKTALSLIADVSRLHRSIQCGTVKAIDVVNYNQSFQSAIHLSEILNGTPLDASLTDQLVSTIGHFSEWFDNEKAKKAVEQPDDIGFLKVGPNSEVAEKACQAVFQKANAWLENLCAICGIEDAIYFKPSEKSMFLVHATKTAAKKLESALKLHKLKYPNIDVKHLTSNSRVEDPALDAFQAELDSARQLLKRCIASEMPQACIEFSEATRSVWQGVEDWIIDVDMCLSMGRTAIQQGWVQPTIEHGDSSSVEIENLRHPLIEIQNNQSKYVTHSVHLGKGATGWLLYGMNASGKSSLMKAIGISVLLAQIGSYVPATSMKLVPFHKIATRILNQDNLWAGLSSFAVEMSELRNMFQIADTKTLVLGDELCSGTESVSATAIVAAGIEWLHKCGSRFVLATHLHDLIKLPKITSLPGLSIWHLHVEYDRVRDILVYHRSLKPGAGSSMYGLEVAKALHLPMDMIESAFAFRRELMGEVAIENATTSSWNSELVKKSCSSCGGFTNLHAHHIQERHDAVGQRNVDGTALHHPRNLTILCEDCHKKHHSKNIVVGVVEDTSEGPIQVIDFEQFAYKPESKVKQPFTKEQVEAIQSMKKEYPELHPKLLVFKIQKEHGFSITEKQLKAVTVV